MAYRQRHSGIKELDTSIHEKKRYKSIINVPASLNRKNMVFTLKSEARNPKSETISSELKCLKFRVPKVLELTLAHFRHFLIFSIFDIVSDLDTYPRENGGFEFRVYNTEVFA